jgi:sulfate adenylyltransferase
MPPARPRLAAACACSSPGCRDRASPRSRALHARLVETRGCAVTLLDGDVVRHHLSRGLGFSRADRDANVLRIGYVASRVVMHAGLVICAPIAPYAATRAAVRAMVQAHGRFVEVHVAAPLAVCEARDRNRCRCTANAGRPAVFLAGLADARPRRLDRLERASPQAPSATADQ